MSEIIRRIDLRTASTENQYFVVFCSRNSAGSGFPGHAYVVWGVEDSQNRRSSAVAFGFYPDDGQEKKAIFSNVSGNLINEAQKTVSSSFLTARLIVQVDPNDFKESQNQIARWQTSQYNLFQRNCISFVYAVAVSLRLFPPQPSLFSLPSVYLLELIKETKGLNGTTNPTNPKLSELIDNATLKKSLDIDMDGIIHETTQLMLQYGEFVAPVIVSSDFKSLNEVDLSHTAKAKNVQTASLSKFTGYAGPNIFGPWVVVGSHIGPVSFRITAKALGNTDLTAEIKYYKGENNQVTEGFIDTVEVKTANVVANVEVRFRGSPFGSAVEGTVFPSGNF